MIYGPDIDGDLLEDGDFVEIKAGDGVGGQGKIMAKSGRDIYIELTTNRMVTNELRNLKLIEKAPKVMFG